MTFSSPPLLLETIRIEGGKAHNLPYHQARMDRSREHLYHTFSHIDLASQIKVPDQEGLYRCRIVYGQEIETIEYLPYSPKAIRHLSVVSSEIHYPHKYVDREALNALLDAHPDADEVIIVQNGLLTDTTIANIALYQEGKWYTPKTPLLEGTMRAKFLDKGLIFPKDIHVEELSDYTHVALMNAMIGFKILNDCTIQPLEASRP